MHLAGLVGLMRQIESISSERKPQFPEQYPNQMFATHTVGAMAEFAVAKELGVEWDGHVNHFSEPDLKIKRGAHWVYIEVRYTPKRDDIKVKDSDKDNTIVVGVRGLPPDFEMLGFCKAGTIRSQCEATSPAPGRPAYFASKQMIRPIEELKDWLKSA